MSNLQRIIWLASYPKSGNTWLRTFLAHYFMPPGQAPDINHLSQFTTGDVRRDFFDAAVGGSYTGSTVEDWLKVRPRALQLIAASKPDHHFVKTHCQPLKLEGVELIPAALTAAAIYVLRNPFDLAPSFARHQNCDIDTAIDRMTFQAAVSSSPHGIFEALGRWDDHVYRWTHAPGLPYHLLRYEDMSRKPAKAFGELISKFFRLEVDKPKLARSVKATSFDKLKKQERDLGFSEKPDSMQSFFAKGRVGVWKEDLTPKQVGRIREAFLPALKELYPEMLKETEAFAARG